MTMSSKYTTTNYSENLIHMSVQNVAGALVRPKGITSHSKHPYRVKHVVFGSSPSAIRTDSTPSVNPPTLA